MGEFQLTVLQNQLDFQFFTLTFFLLLIVFGRKCLFLKMKCSQTFCVGWALKPSTCSMKRIASLYQYLRRSLFCQVMWIYTHHQLCGGFWSTLISTTKLLLLTWQPCLSNLMSSRDKLGEPNSKMGIVNNLLLWPERILLSQLKKSGGDSDSTYKFKFFQWWYVQLYFRMSSVMYFANLRRFLGIIF